MSAALAHLPDPPPATSCVLLIGTDETLVGQLCGSLAGAGVIVLNTPDRAVARVQSASDPVVLLLDDEVGRLALECLAADCPAVPTVSISTHASPTPPLHRTGVAGADVVIPASHADAVGLDLAMTAARDLARARAEARKLADRVETLNARLRELRSVDPLTELASREVLMDRVQRAVDRFQATGLGQFATLFIEVQGFSGLCDTVGERRAELGLAHLAARLINCVPDSALMARHGPASFAVLVEQGAVASLVNALADRIHRSVRDPFDLDGEILHLTLLIGVTTARHSYLRAEEVLRDARSARTSALAGTQERDGIFKTQMHQDAVARVRLEIALRTALQRDELRLHYQPIVQLDTGMLVGFEALIRWERDNQIIPPVTFIPIAEESGLIIPIGRWVATEAIRQLSEWNRDFDLRERLSVSVNVSANQIRDDELLSEIESALARSGLSHSCVKIEFTESVLATDAERVISVLEGFASRGVRVFIDDFSTGYSSLSYLQRFPVHGLKIDRAFVNPLDGSFQGATIARTIMDLAGSLGADVIAEGIENEVQAEQLRAMGCTHGQGYLYSEPLSPGDAFAYVAQSLG